MGWLWGYLATGAVVVGLMVWHADATRRRFEKKVDEHCEAARRKAQATASHLPGVEKGAA